MGTPSFGIRTKLIAIFILIKVVPLLALAWFAWKEISSLTASVEEQSSRVIASTNKVVSGVSELSTQNSIRSLDLKSREAIERLSTDTATQVADFLYGRDGDILLASGLPTTLSQYKQFIGSRSRTVVLHENWVFDEGKKKWVPPISPEAETDPVITADNADNQNDFHYRPPRDAKITENRPLYLEMTFIDLQGNEVIKVGTSKLLSPDKKNVANPANTYCQAEAYFQHLKTLQPGEIYVSEVIGPYVEGHMIGTYTKAKAQNKGINFSPEQSGYAGKENPLGKRFQGLVRWATPVVQKNRIVGYVTLALDHTHIMEFSDHVIPTEERYSVISDPGSGNYAFIWDYKGRNISHARDYFIVGYDPETGKQTVPWLEESMYALWQEKGQSMDTFEAVAPQFQAQSLEKKPAAPLTQEGKLGLDCRYLNFAPQCTGWFNLTQNGGSGSFLIFWSGLWKLTTAATIPYYTGMYGASPRGFGFVTIGANVDDFHRSAIETANTIGAIEADFIDELEQEKTGHINSLHTTLNNTFTNLSLYTLLMIGAVIVIAVLMAGFLTSRITTMILGIRKFQQGDRSHRLQIQSQDEIGELAVAYNEMANSVQRYINDVENSKIALEQINTVLEDEVKQRRTAQKELANHRDNLQELVGKRTQDLEQEIVERKQAQHLQQEVEQRLREQNTVLLNLAGNKVLYSGDVNALFKIMVSLAAKTLQVDRCSIWLLDDDNSARATANYVLDLINPEMEQDSLYLHLPECPQFVARLKKHKALVSHNVYADEHLVELRDTYLTSHNIQSILITSINEHGRFVGWISFTQMSTPRTWHLDEINFANSIADMIGLALDIANQKQAEREKEKLTLRLQRAEKMEAIGTLAGGVAHDLNNILSGIVTLPQYILQNLPEDSPLKTHLQTIENSGAKATKIVSDMLTLSQSGMNVAEVISLGQLINNYLTSPECLQLGTSHPQVEISPSIAPDVRKIKGSAVHLTQVLMNLVNNSADAIDGNGKVTIGLQNYTASTSFGKNNSIPAGEYVHLEVTDTGTGITKEDQPHIFEPFFTKKALGRTGTGLGMMIVWNTIRDHNGFIEVESEHGHGTTMNIYIPATHEAPAAPIGEESQEQHHVGNNEKILVIDDVELQRSIAVMILDGLGYDATALSSGEEAVDYIQNHPVDLIITDMIMEPGISGLETVQQIFTTHPEAKIVLASGYSEKSMAEQALALGVKTLIQKPYDVNTLTAVVHEVLEGK